ncbi:MAG: hypothetical protein EA382_16565 [Spirochaetaceae bacterium]|nr:MAG: hypothetical protein EA382_16565 [Spirochaetaceae bacterium]
MIVFVIHSVSVLTLESNRDAHSYGCQRPNAPRVDGGWSVVYTAPLPRSAPGVQLGTNQCRESEQMTYYISPTGDDSAPGNASDSAWRTFSNVGSVTLTPGDALLLDASGTWHEPLSITAHGADGRPVVIGGYCACCAGGCDTGCCDHGCCTDRSIPGWDDGFALRCRPRIVWGEGAVVSVIDSSWVTIRGLEIHCATDQTMYPDLDGVDDPSSVGEVARHPKDRVNYGVFVHNTIGSPGRGLTVEGVHVHGNGADQNSEGILVTAETTDDATEPTTIGITIANNLVENVGWRGIGTGMQSIAPKFAGVPWQALRDVVIQGNAARLIGLQGICAFNAHSVVMRRNLVDRAGWYRGVGAKWGPAGLWPWSCADVVIEYNEVTGMFDGNTGADATGIDIDWNSRDVIVHNNHCYANMGCGIVTMSCLRGTIERNRIDGNLAKVNIGPGQIALCDFQTASGPHAITGVTDVAIRDNLIILDRDNSTALSTVHISEGPEWKDVRFTDNRVVFFDHARGQYAYDLQEQTSVEQFARNRFYGCDQDGFRAELSGASLGWSAWRDRGSDDESSFAPLDDTSPSRVRDVTAERRGEQITLSWSPATDSRSGVHHYNVYRGDRSDFALRYLTLVGQPTECSFVDATPVDGPHWYAVEAEDACGNRSGYAARVAVPEAAPTGDPR